MLVANIGPDSQLLQAGQKLEGTVVSKTRGTAQVPTQEMMPVTTQDGNSEREPPQINE